MSPQKILMVCLGNICRSPLAEGILRKKIQLQSDAFPTLKNTVVDSAGTGSWHVGQHPDVRSIQVAKKFGVDISKLIGRQFIQSDFDAFDVIFAMDHENLGDIIRLSRNDSDKNKVRLLLNTDKPNSNRSVPDPYYGGEDGFIEVFQLIENACDAIVNELKKK